MKKLIPTTLLLTLMVPAFAQTRTDAADPGVPYQMTGDAASFTNDTNHFKSVPLGRRFVIEHVTFHCVTAPGHVVHNARIKTKTAGIEAVHRLITVPQGTSNGFSWFAVSQPVKLYADSGTSIGIGANSSSGAGQCLVTLSGHLLTTHALPPFDLFSTGSQQ